MTTISIPLSHEHGDVAPLHGRHLSRVEIQEILAVEAEDPEEVAEREAEEGEAP